MRKEEKKKKRRKVKGQKPAVGCNRFSPSAILPRRRGKEGGKRKREKEGSTREKKKKEGRRKNWPCSRVTWNPTAHLPHRPLLRYQRRRERGERGEKKKSLKKEGNRMLKHFIGVHGTFVFPCAVRGEKEEHYRKREKE